MTKYATVILAGENQGANKQYQKINFLVENSYTLLDVALETYSGTSQILVMSERHRADVRHKIKNRETLAIKFLNHPTHGALTSLGMAVDIIPSHMPVVVCPVDGIVTVSITDAIDEMIGQESAASILTFANEDPKYSYVRTENGQAIEIAEKRVISKHATTGVFIFKNKEIILSCLKWALINNVQTEGKYYVAPALNYLVSNRMKISLFDISAQQYFRFSNPEEAEASRERWSNRETK
jgi:Nucleotidyl transferase